MTAPIYKFYYRQYGVRKINQLIKPMPIKVLSLPRGSLFHFYSEDPTAPEIDTSIGFLSMSKSRVLVDFTTEYSGAVKGIPKKKPFITRSVTKDFFKENKLFRYMPDAYKTVNNDLILFIENHSYLNSIYRYPEMPMSEYYKWCNAYSTIFKKINDIAINSNKHQFMYVEIPDDLPTFAIMELYMTRESVQMLKLFNDNHKLLILELWKWMDNEERVNSIFNHIDKANYSKLNIIFKYQDTEILINLGYLNSFLKGQDNTTEFNSITQVANIVLKKLMLRFLINIKNIAIANAVQMTETIDTSGEDPSYNENNDDEASVNIDNTSYLAVSNKEQVVQPVEVEVDSDASIDVDAEISKIDEDLANYNKFYNMKLVSKGLSIDNKGNVSEAGKETEVKEVTAEDLKKDLLETKNPSSILSNTLETLAKSDYITITEYRKFKKLKDGYDNSLSPYDKSKVVKDQIGYTSEDIQIVPDNAKVAVPSVVKDTSLGNISTNSYRKDYLDKLYHKDIINVIYNIQKAGVVVKSHTIDNEASVLGEYEYHRIDLIPLDGAPSTINFKIPKINDDGTYMAGSNKCSLRHQRVD